MTILDRYLLLLFIKIFLVCVLSFSGLFVIIHLFSNLDELTAISKTIGWPQLFVDFYLPRMAELFDQTAAVWTLVAAVFAVSIMQRKRELTAIEAAGITRSRILRSVFLCSIMIIGLMIVNREWLLPQVKDRLVRTAQNWNDTENVSMGIVHDVHTGMKIRGAALSISEGKISNADIQLPVDISEHLPRIEASIALVTPANEHHAAGLLLRQITNPPRSWELNSIGNETQTYVHWPGDAKWLQPNECFVVCNFDPYQAAYGRKLLDYQSVSEMMHELRQPRLWFGNGSQINLHSRVLQPVLDLTLLMLGLPLIISRTEKNIFASAGLCFLIVGGLQLTIIGCHSLGEYSLIKPIALAAWLPAILFTPLAVVAYWRLDG